MQADVISSPFTGASDSTWRDRGPQDLVMADQREAHGVGLFLPQPGGTFDVGEQERHSP